MRVRRGFRSEAEQYAAEYRSDLGVPRDGALCPFRLAALLAIPVVPLSELDDIDSTMYRLNEAGFSATTVVDGTYKMIVHNDAHRPNRQRSDVMHEIAHIALGHPPHPPLTEDGCRKFDAVLENEAKELGFTLLVPKVAALKIVETRMTMAQASLIYGASTDLIEYRIRITDVRRWAQNRGNYRRA